MILKVLVGAGAGIGLLAALVAVQPSTFHYERSVTTSAPPESAFALVNDFRQWSVWSPYEKLDPNMKRTFAGPASGPGAVYSWVSTGKAGEGKMTIEKSTPSQIAIRLEFIKPLAATNEATFRFVPAGDGTKVTWAMDGDNGFASKAASLFMDMDKLIGADFERGLAALKTAAEAAPKTDTQVAKAAP